MKTNQKGIDLIKSFEGCKLKAYKDIVGVWTIGYGHTGKDVVAGLEISQERAEELLKQDLCTFEEGVTKLVKKPIGENQFAALVSFSYNLGLGNLGKSTLLRCINKGNPKDAVPEFLKWVKAGGVEVAGLVRRRKAESELFALDL